MAKVFYILIEKQITRAYCAVEDCGSNCLLIRVGYKMEDECEQGSKYNRQVSPEFERLVQTDKDGIVKPTSTRMKRKRK